jgi:hypothetical protein
MANQLAGKPDFLGSRRDGSEDPTHAAAGNEEDRPGELGSGGSGEGEGGGGVQCGVNLGWHGEAILRWSVRESSEFYSTASVKAAWGWPKMVKIGPT